jgi:hypothetical protein
MEHGTSNERLPRQACKQVMIITCLQAWRGKRSLDVPCSICDSSTRCGIFLLNGQPEAAFVQLNFTSSSMLQYTDDKKTMRIILEGFQVEGRDRFKIFTNQKLLAGAVKGVYALKDNIKLQTFDVMLKKGGKDTGKK